MDYFLVDYENIGEAGLKGIQNLGEDSCTVIFYSEHADKISFDMHQILCNCKSKVEYRKAQTGKKNALDFQLSTYLGFLVASHPDDNFFLVSKDNGYRAVMDFWKDAHIRQVDSIGHASVRTQNMQPEVVMTASEPFRGVVKLHETENAKEPAREKQAVEKPVEKKPAEEKPADKKPADEQTAEKKPAEQKPVDKKPAEQKPAEQKPAEQKPAEERPADKRPGNMKAGDEGGKTSAPAESEALPTAAPKEESPAEPAAKRTHRGGRKKKSEPQEPPVDEFMPSEELRASLEQVIDDAEERENIARFIVKYKTKQGVNNAIVKMYGTEKAGELYRKIKPLLNDKKGK